MSAIAKRAHARLDQIERASKLVAQWRRQADKPKLCVHCRALRRCADQLEAALSRSQRSAARP